MKTTWDYLTEEVGLVETNALRIKKALDSLHDALSRMDSGQLRIFTNIEMGQLAATLANEYASREAMLRDFPKGDDIIQKALRHVHEHYHDVTQVLYGVDGRWLYCGEGFEAPEFGNEIDVSLLEDAASAVITLPAAYALKEG